MYTHCGFPLVQRPTHVEAGASQGQVIRIHMRGQGCLGDGSGVLGPGATGALGNHIRYPYAGTRAIASPRITSSTRYGYRECVQWKAVAAISETESATNVL